MSDALDAIPEQRRAPEGMIWMCGACGKTAEDRYGMVGEKSDGWDESCALNSFPIPRPSSWPETKSDAPTR